MKRKHLTEAQQIKAVRLIRAGHPVSKIAEEMKLTPYMVQRVKDGLKPARPEPVEPQQCPPEQKSLDIVRVEPIRYADSREQLMADLVREQVHIIDRQSRSIEKLTDLLHSLNT